MSAIIDVDIVPETCRRVRLLKHGSDKPLGFYIRDGTSVRVTQNGKLNGFILFYTSMQLEKLHRYNCTVQLPIFSISVR